MWRGRPFDFAQGMLSPRTSWPRISTDLTDWIFIREDPRESVAGFYQGRLKLQFEINGQDYFLNFSDDESRWYVFTPTATGLNRIPVYVDAPKYERIGIVERRRHKIQ